MDVASLKGKIKTAANCLANICDAPRLILTYHRIGADHEPDPAHLSVSATHFAQQLDVLAATCTVVPLDHISTVKKRAVAITFDDGYADILHRAAPLLVARCIPATVFVTSGFVDSQQEAWWDLLAQALLSDHPVPEMLQAGVSTLGTDVPTDTHAQRVAAYQILSRHVVALSAADISALVVSLSQWAGRTFDCRASHRFLTRAELIALANVPGISIGAHSVTHVSLARQSDRLQHAELTQSRRILSDTIGKPIDAFAYPFGSSADVDRSTVIRAKLAGYQVAVTTDPGQVHSWSPPHALRRHTVRDWDGPEFSRQLARFWTRSDHPELV